jgi:hypothetical protein
MKLFIPACGDRIHLTADWSFDLYLEYRNHKFALARGLAKDGDESLRWARELKKTRATVEAGTILECDRVYIRAFSKSHMTVETDYDSITWKALRPDGKPLKGQRFWVKLPDCYSIEYELRTDSLIRDRVKAVRQVMET